MSEAHITHEEADEYALGALEPLDERRVALHVLECAICRLQVEEAQRVTSMLALATPFRRPRRTLRKRVFEAAGIARPGIGGRITRYGTAAAMVATLVVAAAALTGMVSLRGQVGELQDRNVQISQQLVDAQAQEVQIAALTEKLGDAERATASLELDARRDKDLLVALMSPDTVVAAVYSVDAASDAVGRLVWDPGQQKVWFIASGLNQLSDQETYEIWVESGGSFVSLGTFNADESGFARYERSLITGLDAYENAVVTVERWGTGADREGPGVFVLDLTAFRQ